MSDWYKQNIPYILRELVTDLERGLSKEEAKLRVDQYGENLIDRPKQLLLIRNFFAQFRNLTVFSLLVMVAVFVVFRDSDQFRKSLQLDSSNDAVTVAIAIGGILVFQILWRFIEEVRLASQIETIRDRCEVSVSVIRDGNETRIPPTAVVPGDILILIEGDYISADARLVDADNLVVDESYLFGRAALSEKVSSDLQNQTLRLEDWTNMVFGGTYVISGQGYAIAVATGEQLAINDSNHKIPREIEMESEAETEVAGYYKQFRNFGVVLAIVLLGILMFQQPVGWAMYLLVAAALIVASIPEGISLTTRRIIGSNVYDISGKSVLVREPWRFERLSCMDSVCVNEVGISGDQNFTLSSVFVDGQFVDRTMWEGWIQNSLQRATSSIAVQNQVAQPVYYDLQHVPTFPWLLLMASLCVESNQNYQSESSEPHIDSSLSNLVEQIGLSRYKSAFANHQRIPMGAEGQFQSFLFTQEDQSFLQVAFGDTESILRVSTHVEVHGNQNVFTKDDKEALREVIESLSENSTIVISVARKNFVDQPLQDELQSGLTYIGLIIFNSIEDAELKQSVKSCLDSGFKVVTMMDWDLEKSTEFGIDLGLIQDRKSAISREELSGLDDKDFESVADLLLVYSRPTADQKLNVVRTLKRRGHSIGFWGTSADDLQAMRVAGVSFAAVDQADQITQHNAGCIILKGGFNAILDLVFHARSAYENLRGSVRWILSCSIAQMITLLIGFGIYLYDSSLKTPLLLDVRQIVWIQLVIGILSSIGLGKELKTGNLQYNRPQRVPPFLPPEQSWDILMRGVIIALMTNVAFVVSFKTTLSLQLSQTVACTTLVLTLLASSTQCHREQWESFKNRLSNPRWLTVTCFCIILQLAFIYLPFMQDVFKTESLVELKQWLGIGFLSAIMTILPLNLSYRPRTSLTY